ncbi:serine hydrolase domain-containing protein [Nocardia gipuzkoensis]
MARKVAAALDAGVAGADSGSAVPNTVAVQNRPELQQVLEEIVDSGFVGVLLRVNDERGEWVGSAGLAELGGTAKPPIDGHVRIASNTKTFTATLMLQLVADGKIGLDTPAAEYLPEFGLDERITVRMLLQHTSGVFNFTGELYEDGRWCSGSPRRVPLWARSGWTTGSRPTDRRSWWSWRCPSRRVSRRGRAGAIPTPTMCWRGC